MRKCNKCKEIWMATKVGPQKRLTGFGQQQNVHGNKNGT